MKIMKPVKLMKKSALTFLMALPFVTMPANSEAQTPSSTTTKSRVMRTVRLLAGGAAGLVVHESGHVVSSAVFGAHPSVKPLRYGPIPFFRIDHQPVSRRREFVISSAGFWVQHLDSEWILSARPQLRHEESAFLKGILAFDLATSAVYSVAAFGRFGAPERDTLGMAESLGKDGVPEPVVGVLIIGPAVLDGWRYLHPEATWAKWTSRAIKVGLVVLTIRSGTGH
jgi:hypothetical protein